MAASEKFVNISGTTGAFAGSHAVTVAMLVGISGTDFIPIQVTGDGYLLTSGVN